MLPSDLSHIISSAVVPVVIISACGLLALAFYNRLAAIVSRLRGFQRERLVERQRLEQSASRGDRRLLAHLELQTVQVKRRAELIRLTLQFLLLTIGLLIACCLMLSLSALAPKAMYAAVALFVAGLLSMLGGIIAAALELRTALEPVELESQFVTEVLHGHSPGDSEST